ncbi:hypothetical protein BH18ACI2_BH18ACI2_03510 [soil metagenome]
MRFRLQSPSLKLPLLALLLAVWCGIPAATGMAQDTVTGAFEWTVTNTDTGEPVASASALIINQQTGQVITKTSDTRGRFYQGLLAPGLYTIRVSAQGFQTREVVQRLFITRTGEVVPVPVSLDPVPAATAAATPTPTPLTEADTDIRARINASDARQGGSFTEEEVSTLPLGSSTLTRTFDELALLLPGVAPPPQTLGSVAGPGVGAGVGSAGQFAVNGLRSRGNNFTVDGSDNNDEDIGVRRQGFVALIPQPIESIKEYQAITLLAPAQFGRNIGAQVNAVSKSGGSETHGTFYGFFNSSQLNARNFFDTTFGNAVTPLRSGNQNVVVANNRMLNVSLGSGRFRFFPINPVPITVRNQSGGEDSFTLGQGGFAFGGPLEPARGPDQPGRMFYFISAEGVIQNATKEASFAVPTVAQRGLFGTGATSNLGLTELVSGNASNRFTFPVSQAGGNAIFSLFPFPNNPNGVYGENTFTQQLPASARGKILSGKFDGNFKAGERQQSFTARYNFTDDWREIPVTGGALFSTLRPRIRTQNLSLFLNSEVTAPNAARPVFNQVRLSYGRTRLNFEEVRDREFLIDSRFSDPTFGSFGLLNAPLLENFTSPGAVGTGANAPLLPNTGNVFYLAATSTLGRCVATGGTPRACTTEDQLGPVGQINVAGFSPLGIDVVNFPQRRVNNTYQVADTLTLRAGSHHYTFGVDTRRTELNSDLPRNARQILQFNGVLPLPFSLPLSTQQLASPPLALFRLPSGVIRPEDLVAVGAASSAYLTLSEPGRSNIHLRFYQYNFYAQDEWRIRPSLSLSYGLRYEYNTPPRETGELIEQTFDSPELSSVPGLRTFLDGRTEIFDPDRNNFAPRVGIAYLLNGGSRATVVRAGYGLFYDQILGAVVSQSRNVFPSFLTANLAGGSGNLNFGSRTVAGLLNILNPTGGGGFGSIVQPGTINFFNPSLSLANLVTSINCIAAGGGGCQGGSPIALLPNASGVGATLPARRLETPTAHQYTASIEQQLGTNLVVSAAYAGTLGRHLLRFTTPNLGPNTFLALQALLLQSNFNNEPSFFGAALPPGTRCTPSGQCTSGRPVNGVGVINLFEASASSNYNALQLQVRGRLRQSLQFQAGYTYSKALDDVSDVFDLAGASALPQNSFNLDAERGPANFDVRHRFAYNFIYDFPRLNARGKAMQLLFGGLQLAGTGRLQTGQPFTVNSIFDVNLDGNLTDRLNNTNGLERTGDRRQPLRLNTTDLLSLLAPVGQDGQVGRNTFRAGNVIELDLALTKAFQLTDEQRLIFRLDAFNFINRANIGVPVRFLEAPAFGRATDTITPGRRLQFGLKYSF